MNRFSYVFYFRILLQTLLFTMFVIFTAKSLQHFEISGYELRLESKILSIQDLWSESLYHQPQTGMLPFLIEKEILNFFGKEFFGVYRYILFFISVFVFFFLISKSNNNHKIFSTLELFVKKENLFLLSLLIPSFWWTLKYFYWMDFTYFFICFFFLWRELLKEKPNSYKIFLLLFLCLYIKITSILFIITAFICFWPRDKKIPALKSILFTVFIHAVRFIVLGGLHEGQNRVFDTLQKDFLSLFQAPLLLIVQPSISLNSVFNNKTLPEWKIFNIYELFATSSFILLVAYLGWRKSEIKRFFLGMLFLMLSIITISHHPPDAGDYFAYCGWIQLFFYLFLYKEFKTIQNTRKSVYLDSLSVLAATAGIITMLQYFRHYPN